MTRRRFKSDAYFFFLPPFLFFAFFILYPLVMNFLYSFSDLKLTDLNRYSYAGFGNYAAVLKDEVFWISVRNVLIYGAISVPGQIVLGFMVAFLLNMKLRGVRVFRAFFSLPVITSWVVASIIFKFVFTDRGFLNYALTDLLHVTGEPISWLSTPAYALVMLSVLGIWKGRRAGVMVMYLAALQGVPKDLYEAASIDGATAAQSIRHITLPAVRSTTSFVQIMLIIGAFNVFTSVYLITDGGPLHQTEVMLTWLYHRAFGEYDLGYASALSFMFAVPIAALTWLRFRLSGKD